MPVGTQVLEEAGPAAQVEVAAVPVEVVPAVVGVQLVLAASREAWACRVLVSPPLWASPVEV